MGNVRFRMLSDFTHHRANLACVCGCCRHKGVVHRDRVARWYFVHRWPTALEVLSMHLRCHRCGGRPGHISATWEQPTFPEWMASEDAWRQLARRLRG